MNSLFDIVFINPPMSYRTRLGPFERMGSHSPPFNLCYLAGIVRENGYSTAIIDAEADFLDTEKVIKKTLEKNPAYIGITATTLGIMHAADIALELKKRAPHMFIMLGGVHVSALPDETMERYPQFDLAVLGEGEETIIEVLNAKKYNGSLKDINGIICREKDKLIKTQTRALMQNLNELPHPAFDLLENFPDAYRPALLKFKQLPSIMLSTSRGCPYKCIFCDSSVLKDTYRAYSVDYIIDLVRTLKKK
ncbi:cobalamin B12-binding domain-containing protein, partial [Candidatus Desantisbacteria bacterium]|nr:cobalamin B12-binding domain-containing protein [Candidatus Desantisbacteria bacterium]